jgi:fructose transport system ATP-binding protein
VRPITGVVISRSMPHVSEIADRIHIQRLVLRAPGITPQSHAIAEAVAIMTGVMEPLHRWPEPEQTPGR